MGGGTPSAPEPVTVPSASDVEAAEERARLYSMLRRRRGGMGLSYGPRRTSLLAKTQKAAKAFVPAGGWTVGDWAGSGSDGGGGYGTGPGADSGLGGGGGQQGGGDGPSTGGYS